MEVTRTFDLLDRYEMHLPDKEDALAAKENGQWVTYGVRRYREEADAVSRGLLALGLQPGDKIVTITPNRPEWNFLDMGMAQIGVIHVPLFATLQAEEYESLLTHAEPVLVVAGTQGLYEKVAPMRDKVPSLEEIYTIDEVEGVPQWLSIRDQGNTNMKQQEEVERIKKEIAPSDIVTLIYTSGTTGDSKGVMLTHENLLSNAKAAAGVFQLQPDERYLCILPLCHVGERMANYQTQYSGCSIYYNENIGTIAQDMQEIRPHGFGAVPRILERVYDKIISKGEKLTGLKRKLFFWALRLGKEYELTGKSPGYKLQLKLANKLIFSKWREAMGGRVRSIGVGGAALPSQLERVFWAADIKLLNMYGLTETSPIITINRKTLPDLKLGTVGAPIEGVDVKIAEDGEVLCKGPNVMKGYYKREEATKEAFDEEGWFRTGDVGVLEEGKFLRITDRKKSIFKLSNGKYVAPQFIENKFKESLYVDQIMVIGEGEKFTSALIAPNFEVLREWAKENGITSGEKEALVEDAGVTTLFKGIVEQVNQELEKDQQIRRYRLITEEWSPDSGELSPTLKLKRKVLQEKYRKLIGEIYGK